MHVCLKKDHYFVFVSVSCPSAISIANGNFVTSTDGEITSASYQCFNGYSMKGEQTLECGQTGTWSSLEPECGTS